MAEQEFQVVLHGFKTKEQAQEFIDWYEGAGEQDAYYWLSEHVGFSANVNVDKNYDEKGNQIHVFLNIIENEN